jgi:hypothetical protein
VGKVSSRVRTKGPVDPAVQVVTPYVVGAGCKLPATTPDETVGRAWRPPWRLARQRGPTTLRRYGATALRRYGQKTPMLLAPQVLARQPRPHESSIVLTSE